MSANEIYFKGHDNVINLQYIYDGLPYKFLDQGATDLHIILKNKGSGTTYTKTKLLNAGVVAFDNAGNITLALGKEGDIPAGVYEVVGVVKGLHGASKVIIENGMRKSSLKIKAIEV